MKINDTEKLMVATLDEKFIRDVRHDDVCVNLDVAAAYTAYRQWFIDNCQVSLPEWTKLSDNECAAWRAAVVAAPPRVVTGLCLIPTEHNGRPCMLPAGHDSAHANWDCDE